MIDLQKAVEEAARAASAAGVSLDDLATMLRTAYEAEHAKRQEQEKKKRGPYEGMFVDYQHPKKGLMLGHVLRVHDGDRVDLRIHDSAKPDFDVLNVPFSEKISVGHWSRSR